MSPPGFSQGSAFLREQVANGNATGRQKETSRTKSGKSGSSVTFRSGPSGQGLAADALLKREQEPLAVQAAAVAGQAAASADHPVTRDHDRDRVPAVGQADRARCRRLADPGGQL